MRVKIPKDQRISHRAKEEGGSVPCSFVSEETGEPCRRPATSVDHFTPRCIAPLLGWTPAETNAPENLQPLCHEHHREKDRDTSLRRDVLRAQLNGELTVGFGGHQRAMDEMAERRREEAEKRAKAGNGGTSPQTPRPSRRKAS